MLLIKTDAQIKIGDNSSVYLGPWCRDIHDDSKRSILLPHHLDNANNVDNLKELSDSMFDDYIPKLSVTLNSIHGIDWSVRSWSVLIGPWLSMFLNIIIDRFETINNLKFLSYDIYTYANSYPSYSWAPADTAEFINLAAFSDQFNEYLFSKILIESSDCKHMVREIFPNVRVQPQNNNSLTLKQRIKKGLLSVASRRYSNDVTFVDSYFSTFDQIKLECKIGQVPYFPPSELNLFSGNADQEKRARLKIQPHVNDPLNNIVIMLLSELFPKYYLEEFKLCHELTKKKYPKKTKIILTGHAYSYNESFRFWAASQVNDNVKLVCVQHGGSYGIGPYWSSLQHEFRVADYYCTAGWTSQENPSAIPMPMPKLEIAKNKYKADNQGNLLWVWRAIRPYCIRVGEGSINKDVEEYLDEQKRFGRALKESLRHKVKIRLRGGADKNIWNEKKNAASEFKDMIIDDGNTSFVDAARGTRLWVITYNSTTLLEALASNIPFVLFWNPSHGLTRLSDEAKPLFDELRHCGVMHETPESAAQTVNDHYADPESWWNGVDIQNARLNICEKFAMTKDNWLDIWADKLQEILEE